MFALYVSDSRFSERLCRALQASKAVPSADWPHFERAAESAECSVIVIGWLSVPEVDRLMAFKSRHPLHPVVLVTRGDMQNARQLKAVQVEEVIWLEEMDHELSGAVSRTCTLSHHRSFCEAMSDADYLPGCLAPALARACSAEPPLRTVQKLATLVGCDRRTLWQHWRAVTDGEELRLQDVLHWLLLLRATSQKTPGRSWATVADELGVHPQTLGRISQQLTGHSLRELAGRRQGEMVDRFEHDVLGVLLRSGMRRTGSAPAQSA
jgi:AraC-like DNA-binding protein